MSMLATPKKLDIEARVVWYMCVFSSANACFLMYLVGCFLAALYSQSADCAIKGEMLMGL